MKQFEYSKKSWHFRLASTYGDIRTEYRKVYLNDEWIGSETYYDGDLCTYIRHMIVGLFKLSGISLACLIGLLPMTLALTYLVACIVTGQFIPLDGEDDAIVVVGIGLWSVLFICFSLAGYHFAKEKYREKYPKPEIDLELAEPKDPSFATIAYRKFKDKTCARILVK
jgi:hypothetical protein